VPVEISQDFNVLNHYSFSVDFTISLLNRPAIWRRRQQCNILCRVKFLQLEKLGTHGDKSLHDMVRHCLLI